MSKEVEIDGQIYLLNRFTGGARKQFHVFRRLLPALSSIGPLLALKDSATLLPSDNGEIAEPLLKAVGGLADAIGAMSDIDADYVMDTCLDAIQFKTAGGWQRLRASNGAMMLSSADDLAVQMRLVFEVLMENLGSFSQPLTLAATNGLAAGVGAAPATELLS